MNVVVRVIASHAGAARMVRTLRARAAEAGLSGDMTHRLALVTDEWLANALEHGGPPVGSRLVVRLVREAQAVRLILHDGGIPFDPRTAVFEGPNPERGGGVGLELLRAFAEVESWRRVRGRNRTVLRLKSD